MTLVRLLVCFHLLISSSSLANGLETLIQNQLESIATKAKSENQKKWIPVRREGVIGSRHYDAWEVQGTKTNPELFVRRYDTFNSSSGKNRYEVVDAAGRKITNQEYAEFLIRNKIVLSKKVLSKYQINRENLLADWLAAKKFKLPNYIFGSPPQTISFGLSGEMTWTLKEQLQRVNVYSIDVNTPFGTIPAVIKLLLQKNTIEQTMLENFGNKEGVIGYFGAVEGEKGVSQIALLMEQGKHPLMWYTGSDLLKLFAKDPSQEILHLVRALKDVHSQGYARHDIQPYNIVLNSHNHLVFIDFGAGAKIEPAQKETEIPGLAAILRQYYLSRMVSVDPNFLPKNQIESLQNILIRMEKGTFASLEEVEDSLKDFSRQLKH